MTAWLPSWTGSAICMECRALKIRFKKIKSISTAFLFIFFPLFIHSPVAHANSLSISNVRLLSQNASADTILIEFDITWDNSWKDSVNNDAAWVFFKYQCSGAACASKHSTNQNYYHATLKTSGTNPSGFSTGSSGTAVDVIVPSDKKGCFIQRKSQGSGTVTTTDIQVVWDYGADTGGVTDLDRMIVSYDVNLYINAYGIEMVYIPQGGFHVGDGNSGVEGEFEFGSSTSLPAPINSEDGFAFTSAGSGGWFYNNSGTGNQEFAAGASFNVPSSFPKGFNAFYLMKYEITQGQYVSFLNSLTRDQQNQRVASTISGSTIANFYVMVNSTSVLSRNTVTCASTQADTSTAISFSATSAGGVGRDNRVEGFLSWMDFAAYADWAALRPMTEFEYEKACRGPIYPVVNEYAWGGTNYSAAKLISGAEIGTELSTTPGTTIINSGGASFIGGDGGNGPLRSGFFATSTTATRIQTGAGYYGSMELAGNVQEWVVTVGNSAGLSFSGTHGDGVLTDISGTTNDGNATNLDWPGLSTTNDQGVTAATGAGQRGWGFGSLAGSNTPRISNRSSAVITSTTKLKDQGGRLARTSP